MSEAEIETEEKRMTFTEHLGELRDRLIRSGIAFIVAFVACIAFARKLVNLLTYPITEGLAKADPPVPLVVMSPTEAVFLMFKLASYCALILASPYIIYQITAFVFPGLKKNERQIIRVVIFGSGGLVIVGISLAYFIVLPIIIPALIAYTPEGIVTQLRLSETVSFILLSLIGFAVAFQFPMVVLVLSYMGLVTGDTLRKHRKMAVLVIAVASAILTPSPDPISMVIMLVSLYSLYELSILLSRVVWRRKAVAGAE